MIAVIVVSKIVVMSVTVLGRWVALVVTRIVVIVCDWCDGFFESKRHFSFGLLLLGGGGSPALSILAWRLSPPPTRFFLV